MSLRRFGNRNYCNCVGALQGYLLQPGVTDRKTGRRREFEPLRGTFSFLFRLFHIPPVERVGTHYESMHNMGILV